MNNPFTTKIVEVLAYSAEEARRLGSTTIAPEHLLLGLIRDGLNEATFLLETIHVDLHQLRSFVLDAIKDKEGAPLPSSSEAAKTDEMSLDATANQIMKLAQLEARADHEEDRKSVV